MTVLTPDEFTRMERLLANPLPECDAQAEAVLLSLHARLQAIYASQSELSASRDRLKALRSQTA